jgi:hypothetical protein
MFKDLLLPLPDLSNPVSDTDLPIEFYSTSRPE